MKNGVDPAKHGSEKAVREKLAETLRQKQPEVSREQPEAEARGALSRIVLEAEYIKPAKRKQAEEILLSTAKALSALLDRRRITDYATKAALSEVALAQAA